MVDTLQQSHRTTGKQQAEERLRLTIESVAEALRQQIWKVNHGCKRIESDAPWLFEQRRASWEKRTGSGSLKIYRSPENMKVALETGFSRVGNM